MDLAAGALFGLVSLVCWGVADFLAKRLVDRLGAFNALFFEQAIAVAALAPVWLLTGGLAALRPEVLPLLFVTAIIWTYPYLLFYKALEKGMLSVISPIVAAWGAGGAVLAAVFLNEALSPIQWASIAVIVAGLFLVSASWKELRKLAYHRAAGVGWAVLAMLGWGASAVLSKPLVAEIGPFAMLVLLKALSLPLLLVALPVTAYALKAPRRSWKLVGVVAAINALGIICYNYGIGMGQVSVVGPISAAFPIVTVSLAWMFMKDRLETGQWLGVALTILGMVALAVV